jgi:hypothetical protein
MAGIKVLRAEVGLVLSTHKTFCSAVDTCISKLKSDTGIIHMIYISHIFSNLERLLAVLSIHQQ